MFAFLFFRFHMEPWSIAYFVYDWTDYIYGLPFCFLYIQLIISILVCLSGVSNGFLFLKNPGYPEWSW